MLQAQASVEELEGPFVEDNQQNDEGDLIEYDQKVILLGGLFFR